MLRPIKYVLAILAFGFIVAGFATSCKKWVDPKTKGDSLLTNPYCNDPNAVNYNWGFPGRPDDSICFYPVDLFRGTYGYRDTIFRPDGTIAFTDSVTLQMYALSETKLAVVGFCGPADTLRLTAGPTYIATVDTVGTVAKGQLLCRVQDTVSGTMTKDRFDTTFIHISLTVNSDTGYTLHAGTAIKL